MSNVKLTNDDLNKVVEAVKKSKQSAKIFLNTNFNEIVVVIGMHKPDSVYEAIDDEVWDLGSPYRNCVSICGDTSELKHYKVIRV